MNLKRIIRRFPLVSRAAKSLRAPLGRAYMALCHGAGAKKNTVFFSSFIGKSYNDSPRYICEELMKLRPDIDIVWQLSGSATGRDRVPAGVKCVPPHSLQALKAIATAKVIVDNFNRPFYMPKFDDQYYIQTWHGDRALKKILYDMNDGKEYPDRKYMDLCIAGSDFGTRLYRTAFRYDGEVLQCGMPRNDVLLHPDADLMRRTRETLGISSGVKVLLYAPTFRNQNVAQNFIANIDLIQTREALEKTTGEKWICLARGHVNNPGVVADGTMDVSSYPEMAELLLITDLFITDYSSGITDYQLLNRPLLLFQPDRASYLKDDRAFYFDMDASPFPIATSMDEVLEKVKDLDALAAACPKLNDFFGVTESGDSARLIAQRISDIMK